MYIVCCKACPSHFDFQTFHIQWGWLKLHTPLYAVIPLVGDTSKQQCTIVPVVVTPVLIPPWVRAASSEVEAWNSPSSLSLCVSVGGGSLPHTCDSKWERMFQYRQKLTCLAGCKDRILVAFTSHECLHLKIDRQEHNSFNL